LQDVVAITIVMNVDDLAILQETVEKDAVEAAAAAVVAVEAEVVAVRIVKAVEAIVAVAAAIVATTTVVTARSKATARTEAHQRKPKTIPIKMIAMRRKMLRQATIMGIRETMGITMTLKLAFCLWTCLA